LRSHLGVSAGTESQFIPRYFYRLPEYGDLAIATNRQRLVRDLLHERWFERTRKFGFSTSVEAVMREITAPTFRGVLDAIFGLLARHQQMSRWSDKTPEYVYHLPMLGSVFPDGKYIHIVRDGRDVALSVFRESWGPKNVTTAALEWVHTIELTRAFSTTLAPGQFLELRYEDLLQSPEREFARLMSFLALDDDRRLLPAIVRQANGELLRGNFNKWKTAMSPRDVARFDSLAGYLLTHYRYETCQAPLRKASRLEALYWEADSRVRRWLRPDNVRDSLYRASLALRRREASPSS
ncbi:MAG: sulfotransferase, partial [Bryobacteraceae bacterium]|nr:sulfotransferase [Bryobacteraceae bacterium]